MELMLEKQAKYVCFKRGGGHRYSRGRCLVWAETYETFSLLSEGRYGPAAGLHQKQFRDGEED